VCTHACALARALKHIFQKMPECFRQTFWPLMRWITLWALGFRRSVVWYNWVHGAITQKASVWILTALKTSDLVIEWVECLIECRYRPTACSWDSDRLIKCCRTLTDGMFVVYFTSLSVFKGGELIWYRVWEETIVACICLERARETNVSLSQDRRWPGRDWIMCLPNTSVKPYGYQPFQ
jgi:hypothetical protein